MNTLKLVKLVSTAILGFSAFAGTAYANNPKAVTWEYRMNVNSTLNSSAPADLQERNKVLVQPTADFPDGGTLVGCQDCNAYSGDQPETLRLRMLCFIPSNTPIAEPAAYVDHFETNWTQGGSAINNWRFYYGFMTNGSIGLTKRIKGTNLTSQQVANQKCENQFGAGARILDHHDNGVGGWNVGAMIHPDSKAKHLLTRKFNNNYVNNKLEVWRANGTKVHKYNFWVSVNNQPSNLWD